MILNEFSPVQYIHPKRIKFGRHVYPVKMFKKIAYGASGYIKQEVGHLKIAV